MTENETTMSTKQPTQQELERLARQAEANIKAATEAAQRACNSGGFWQSQTDLAMAMQREVARTITARRIDGEPATGDELLKLMHVMELCGVIMAEAEERRGESDAGCDS